MAPSAAGDTAFSFLSLGLLPQIAPHLSYILAIEVYMLAESGKGDPAPLGDLRNGHLGRA